MDQIFTTVAEAAERRDVDPWPSQRFVPKFILAVSTVLELRASARWSVPEALFFSSVALLSVHVSHGEFLHFGAKCARHDLGFALPSTCESLHFPSAFKSAHSAHIEAPSTLLW